MSRTIRFLKKIPVSRRIGLRLPDDVPAGEAEVVLVVTPRAERRRCTCKDLLESEIWGMWADRTDIADSAEYARELREPSWRRA